MRAALYIAERELRETLRDGRVIGMFLFPLVLYPVMLWALTQYSLLTLNSDPATVLAWEGDPSTPEWLEADGVTWVPGGQAAVASGAADGWVRGERGSDGIRFTGEIPAVPGSPEGELRAAAFDLRQAEAARLATVYSVPATTPWVVQSELEDSHELDLTEALSKLAPLLPGVPALGLVLLTTMAFYPALDAAAERERGTLATSLVSVASPAALVWGKLITVCTLALLAVVAQGTALLITLAHLVLVLIATLNEDMVITWPAGPGAGPLLAAGLVFAAAGIAIGALQLVAVLPWRTLQSSESAASVAMTGTIGLIGLGYALGDNAIAVPIANAVPIGAAALQGLVEPRQVVAALLVDVGLVLALAETARRIVASEAYRR
ncbi:MAG: hypothetical protein ACI8PZ_001823 [Myxococcota bacterium]|jgi:hypothetical protein